MHTGSRRLATIASHLLPDERQSFNHLESSPICGIIGYVGTGNAANYVIEGLKILENRGYDSAGITTISPDHQLVTTKYASNDTTSDSMIKLSQIAPSKFN